MGDDAGGAPVYVNAGDEVRGRFAFRLDRMLGRGGFGSVWHASCLGAPGPDGDIPLEAAVKVLSADLRDKHRRHSMQRELSALLAIRNDRIPRVYDWSLDGPQPFIAMEYFRHGTLQQLVTEHGPLPEADSLDLLADLLAAVVAASRQSVLHLDIKPANVLLDGSGGFVLTDFGISQAPRAGLPMSGLGSPGFQSPEQEAKRTNDLDLRTDLHAIGATVWSSLTGVDLGSTEGLLLRKRAANSPIVLPPISMKRKVSPALEQLVMELLLRDQSARPGDPHQVLVRVEDLAAGRAHVRSELPGVPVDAEELRNVVGAMLDPLVARIFHDDHRGVRRLRSDEHLCLQGERSHHAWVLLRGAVRIVQNGVEIARVDREGEFLGEIAALTGEPRGATVVAAGPVWVRVLDAAQLEAVVTGNPALGVRLIRAMANRFAQPRG